MGSFLVGAGVLLDRHDHHSQIRGRDADKALSDELVRITLIARDLRERQVSPNAEDQVDAIIVGLTQLIEDIDNHGDQLVLFHDDEGSISSDTSVTSGDSSDWL